MFSSSPLSRDTSALRVYRDDVTIETARRLLASGAVTSGQVQDALLIHVNQSVPFVYALLTCGADPNTIENELHFREAPQLRNVVPALELVHRLPIGMCSQLFAVPVRLDPMTMTVDVAVADPCDSHIQQEFAFQLGSPVRLVQCGLNALRAAIEAIEAIEEEQEHLLPPSSRPASLTPAQGIRMARIVPLERKTNSDAPIPLVRRSKLPRRYQEGASAIAHDPIVLNPGSLAPIKSSGIDASSTMESFEVHIPRDPGLPSFEGQHVAQCDAIFDELAQASTRDDVVVGILRCMAVVSGCVGVFAVRREAFTGWACTRSFMSEEQFKRIRVDKIANSIFAQAASEGWYFGPIPNTREHEGLVDLLPECRSEVSMTAVRIQGRTVMLILAAELFDSMIATRTAERLAKASAKALLRVLQMEKRQDR